VCILGAGLAGAATAWHLTVLGMRDVLVLEREALAGMHSSGRNAALVRQVTGDAVLSRFAVRSARAIVAHVPELFRRSGSLLLLSGKPGSLRRWNQEIVTLHHAGVDTASVGSEACVRLAPWLREGPVSRRRGIWTATDGVVDAHGMLQWFLAQARAAGARVRFDCALESGRALPGGGFDLRTSAGPVRAETVVNAAGGWAAELAERLGAPRRRVLPSRRHLFVTGPLPEVNPSWPWVWDLERGFYFRPESGGLLLSACDQDPWPAELPPSDPRVAELLAGKLSVFPRLSGLPILRSWAGLRTHAPDGRFVLGPDPALPSLFWVAALGGHGVTCAFAVGETAARWLVLGEPGDGASCSAARLQT
jgi:D-arginine dehydrogenase